MLRNVLWRKRSFIPGHALTMQSNLSALDQASLQLWLRLSQLAELIASRLQHLQRIASWIPPSGLVLLSCFAIQAGTAGTKTLFDQVGVIGAVFVCKLFAAILLLVWHRPSLKGYAWKDYRLVIALGLAIAGAVMGIYEAVARIPMGIASTIEFIGPLSLAVAGSRRKRDLVWVVLAAIGVLLLSPINNLALDWVGVGFALVAAGCWGGYIVFSKRVGRVFPGGTGLAMAMTVAAMVMMPMGMAQAGTALFQPEVLMIGAGIGFMGTVLPYSLEYLVLKRMSPRVFGVLMSIEPAIAALVGFIFLREHLNIQSSIAILLVTAASAGITLSGQTDQ
jgi:inner membrane transporter RhtA